MSGRMSWGIGDKFSYMWKGEEKRQYNEMLLQVQQTISWHKEHTRVRLQKIEDMLELAVNKLSLIRQIKQDSKEEGFLNLIECRKIKKQHSECKSEAVSQESLLNLNLRIPNCEGLGVCEVSGIGSKAQDWSNLPEELLSQETCTVEPIYDKEPGEKQESWPEQEFILKALNGGHINSPNPLPSEVCTSERSEDGDEPLHTQVIQDRKIHSQLQKMATTKFGDGMDTGFCLDCPALNGPQRLCKQVCLFIVSKEGPTTRLDNNQSVLVPKECSKGMTDESVQVLSATTDLYSDSKRARMLARPSRCIDLRQGSPGKVMRFEIHDAWRRKYTITIFDPGGRKWSHEINHEDMVVFQRREICQEPD